VTFNYDTLLENALRGIDVQLSDINSYVSNPNYKLFKLHGSTDWWAWRSAQTTKVRLDHHSSEAELIRAAPELEGEATIQKEGDPPPHLASRELYHHYPAVAIPTLSKFGFICPSGHVEVLAQCIKKVDKIAIVGWRAGEKHFLEMLSKGLQSVVDVIAACGNYEAAKDTLRNVANAGIRVNQGTAEPGGFTEFVLNRRIESFLR
jgi:hypothetical protein